MFKTTPLPRSLSSWPTEPLTGPCNVRTSLALSVVHSVERKNMSPFQAPEKQVRAMALVLLKSRDACRLSAAAGQICHRKHLSCWPRHGETQGTPRLWALAWRWLGRRVYISALPEHITSVECKAAADRFATNNVKKMVAFYLPHWLPNAQGQERTFIHNFNSHCPILPHFQLQISHWELSSFKMFNKCNWAQNSIGVIHMLFQ